MAQYNRPVSEISVVYKATNAINGDFYIGITCGYLSRRKSKHRRSAQKGGSQGYFHRAIRKHGWENFSFSILSEWADYEDAKKEEIRLIAALKPRYNMTEGGDGARGYKHTPEVVAAIVKRSTGRPGYWKGKNIPPHVVENLRRIQAGRTDKARVLAMGPKSMQRRVVCLDDGAEFESVSAAAANYSLNGTVISSVCNKKRHRTAGGLVFRFYGDHLGGKDEADSVRRQKAHKLKTGFPSYSKAVTCRDDGLVFDSVKAAADHYGIETSRIIKSAKGKYKSKIWETIRFSYVEAAA